MRMKRILMLLAVVALMVVMLAMSVAPAFARGPSDIQCVFIVRHLSELQHPVIPAACVE